MHNPTGGDVLPNFAVAIRTDGEGTPGEDIEIFVKDMQEAMPSARSVGPLGISRPV